MISPEQEMLQFAAKAANVFLTPETLRNFFPKWEWDESFDAVYFTGVGMFGTVVEYSYSGELSGTTKKVWNPLTSIADCANMEAALDINVEWWSDRVVAWVGIGSRCGGLYRAYFNAHNNDKQAARMRAVTRVAAEIGSAMP